MGFFSLNQCYIHSFAQKCLFIETVSHVSDVANLTSCVSNVFHAQVNSTCVFKCTCTCLLMQIPLLIHIYVYTK